ncbi:MAG: mechanosensitive ion channel domain-containing protein [Planctomycetota bacterium]
MRNRLSGQRWLITLVFLSLGASTSVTFGQGLMGGSGIEMPVSYSIPGVVVSQSDSSPSRIDYQTRSTFKSDFSDPQQRARSSEGWIESRPEVIAHRSIGAIPFRDADHYGHSKPLDESAAFSLREFRRIAARSQPIIAQVANTNADLVQRWVEVNRRRRLRGQQLATAEQRLQTTQQDFSNAQAKLKQYGLTGVMGRLLRRKRDELSTWQIQESNIQAVRQDMDAVRVEELELELIPYSGIDPAKEASLILAGKGSNSTTSGVRLQLESLLGQRYQWLLALRAAYQQDHQNLADIDRVRRESTALAKTYRQFINRHVTWIPEDEPIGLQDVMNLKAGFAALFDPSRSADAGPTLNRKFTTETVSAISLLVLIVVLLMIRWQCKRWLAAIADKRKLKSTSVGWKQLLCGIGTVVIATIVPCCLYAFSRWLGSGIVSESTLHSSHAFSVASLIALAIEMPRQSFRSKGFLDQYLKVDLPGRSNAFRYLTLAAFVFVIGGYAITIMSSIDHGIWRGGIARMGFLVLMLALAWTMHLMLRPKAGWAEPIIRQLGGRVIHRARFALYALGIVIPLLLAALASLGYGYTSRAILARLLWTSSIVIAAALIWPGTCFFASNVWHALTDRREAKEARHHGTTEMDALANHFLELKHHLAFLSQCGLILMALAILGWIWLDALPSTQLGNPVLWTSGSNDSPVTTSDLVLAAASIFLAFQFARLLPALFDALVLQRVSFDEAMEHLLLVAGRVALFSIGCVIAFRLLGLQWQTIQWLAVGLTVGIGFGLQDLVRNFFGGFVVLFEKPARLGDRITIGEITGRVAMQRLRTTLLSDDDGREVIVPNQRFVSDDVINWRASGRLKSIKIELSVTRDRRAADICRSLQELTAEQPWVLVTPAPRATLMCVGRRWQRVEIHAWTDDSGRTSECRSDLLRTLKRYLSDNNWLGDHQPKQPLPELDHSQELEDVFGPARRRDRKRSA